MKLISLKINGFKNLDMDLDFTQSEGISVFVGNNGSGKSNILEAISAIFYGLYNKKDFDPSFEFDIRYLIKIEGLQIPISLPTSLSHTREFRILHEEDFLSFYLDGKNISISNISLQDYLPENVIALYSGEETRLYENYYKNIDKNFYNKRNMIFIDKQYWEIALLIMFISVVNFNESDNLYQGLSKILGDGINIDKIEFIRSKSTGKLLILDTQRKDFLEIIKSINNKSILEINTIKNGIPLLSNSLDFYKGLLHYSLGNENVKYINDINLTFNTGINSKNLSEGQKKQILIYFATNFLADEDSIILLDEPDSYIHVGNKEKIKNFITDFLNIRKEGEFIMTTHSPTLMHKFDKKHIFYLESGKLNGKDKAGILKEIAGDTMSYTEQQIALNTTKDILLVEGKLDIIFIETALDLINEEKYNVLKESIIFIPTGGASGLRFFIDKFTPKDNQKIIGILDNDKAGKDEIKEILKDDYEKDFNVNGFAKITELKNTFLIKLPKLPHILNEQYEIEDYFPLEKMLEIAKIQVDTFKVLKDFSLKKDTVKKELSRKCGSFNKSDFENFKVLFDLILGLG